ncbi:bifunctional folylpolyglutamate synthase/dihydrofolate synthase [Oceanobacillus piezotolerans]|uniref:Dihydrofolate synthase/folylpolyglutamate synthase n=1 Tax=Oceanobacillus piezotolerans TaxID=2448030 RepID=A0A498DMA3_9BACI|nr:folylpolyglutamate synthase/dihydrofolate synthase family protein [Oceanobacillus piezotolerans]RLL44902.1 bifunctional folylpolyglutamate synthase/dihydrofolate synthase [Oceanobacillus piezotolerans]
MNYQEALNYIHTPMINGMKFGLERMQLIMEALGNPQDKLKVIHIAGTNGKGSVASYLSHVLTSAGYKTGLFTSPFLEAFNERFKINNQEIENEALSRITGLVKEKVEAVQVSLSEFELITAIAFQYFHEEQCDVVVLEVGLGGRLDSTNIIHSPVLSIITSIGYDHQAYLGDTLPEIAGEKAGIIKEGRPVILYPQEKETEDVILGVASEKNSKVVIPDFSQIKLIEKSLEGQTFDYKDCKQINISLLGEHQLKNAALVIEAIESIRAEGFKIDGAALIRGLAATKWPGRFEVIKQRPTVIIDGAHNIDSVRTLMGNLTTYFHDKRMIAIFGVLKDKDVSQMIEEVSSRIQTFITVTPDSPRAMLAGELADELRDKNLNAISSESYEEAVELALKMANTEDIICSFGSLYYIGSIRRVFNQLEK